MGANNVLNRRVKRPACHGGSELGASTAYPGPAFCCPILCPPQMGGWGRIGGQRHLVCCTTCLNFLVFLERDSASIQSIFLFPNKKQSIEADFLARI